MISSSQILRTFPNDPLPDAITHGDGLYLTTSDGSKYLDLTSGFTGHSVLGWGDRRINEAIISQLTKIPHIDYKMYSDPNRDKLACLLLDRAAHGLDRLFLCGGSGGEACEAAVHLSFQVHYEQGKSHKKHIISRTQSYHGATTECMALGERPNLEFYRPLFPDSRSKVTEHNIYRHKLPHESMDDYGRRSALELETEILRVGPENVCAFVAETIMGGLVGDVPPTPNYWPEIRRVCDKYDVHLILDEVWCGCGVSGKNFCIDWDQITPDFIFLGKTLAGGYLPLSAVVTSSKVEEVIKQGSGRLENSTTFQGHSACVAAAVACQQIINEDGFLSSVCTKGDLIRSQLLQALSDHDFFQNVRGRGVRNTVEYSCPDQNLFGQAVAAHLKEKYKILITGKWHRLSFSNAMTITNDQIDFSIEAFVQSFIHISSMWTPSFRSSLSHANFF